MRPIIILVAFVSCVLSSDITKEPTDSPIYHHSTTAPVKFTCTYTGSDTVTARMWTNSINYDEDVLSEEHAGWISSTKSYTFTWTDPSKCPEAIYTCAISLNTGKRETATFDLKINFVSLLHGDLNANAGEDEILMCSVITAESTVLEWKRLDDGLVVPSNSTMWYSSTNNRTSYLNFSSVAQSDGGSWICQISDTEYSTTNTTLRVIDITTSPAIPSSAFYSHVNSKLQLIVSVSGPMTVSAKTWTDSIGTDEDELNDVYASYDAGTNTTTLAFPKPTSKYDGSYTCVISFSNGHKATTVFKDVKISLITMSQNDVITDNTDKTLSCSVKTGSNTNVLKWINYSNGSVQLGDINYNSATSTLTSSLKVSGYGVYGCKISDTEYSVTNTTVHFVVFTGTNATVQAHSKASIKCDIKIIGADWLKKSTLVWKEGGTVVSSGNGLTITTGDVTNSVVSSSLVIANVSAERTFSCGATLSSQWYGASVGVKLFSGLKFLSSEVNAVECNGTKLTCVVMGNQQPAITWSHSGQNISTAAQTYTAPLTTSILTLTYLNVSDQGNYTCTVEFSNPTDVLVNVAELDLHTCFQSNATFILHITISTLVLGMFSIGLYITLYKLYNYIQINIYSTNIFQ